MTRVKIAELKDHLSEHLRAVENGAELEVTDRNRPIARISPLRPDDTGIEVVRAKRRFSAADRKPMKPANWGIDSLELLLEERGER